MRARKICSSPGCFNLQPCPDHERKPWEGSRRSDLAKVKGRTASNRRKRILLKYDTICHVCGNPGSDEVDHVIPLAEGGPDTDANCRPIHSKPCHALKSSAEAARARRANT